MKVLVTRPEHQAQPLSEALKSLGAEVVQFSTLKIVPVEDQESIKNTLENVDLYDIAVFISANAVFNAAPYLISITEKTLIIAMGPATSRALIEAGFKRHYVPAKPYTTEALLEMPIFYDVNAQKILIIKGEGGRNLLANKLSERGAQVTQLSVYRRECPESDPEVLKSFWEGDDQRIIVVTSGESLRNLYELTPVDYRSQLFETPLMVVSPRVAEIAREIGGFAETLVADSAQDEAIIAKFKEWCAII